MISLNYYGTIIEQIKFWEEIYPVKYLTLLEGCFYKVDSLNCVQCTSCTSPWSNTSNPIRKCSLIDPNVQCSKYVITYPGGSTVVKACVLSSVCQSKDFVIAGYGAHMSCCSTDGCNGAASVKYSFTAILIAYLHSIATALLIKL